MADVYRECDPHTLLAQIGRMNVFAISGGRVRANGNAQFVHGITLPVSNGYSVTVDLDADDTYVVRRVFKRGAKVWIKGELRGVYCEDVGEAAYRASCFRNGDWHPVSK